MAMDDAPPVAWHVQDLTVADAALVAEYGVARGVGLSLTSFYRQGTTRIHFQDLERRPLGPPPGDIHHPNATLTGGRPPWAPARAPQAVGKRSPAPPPG